MGDGLVLRWSTAADLEQIGILYETVFRQKPDQPLGNRMTQWALDVGSGRHPAAGPGDFALVEDTQRGQIAAALMVLRQTWRYDEIPFEIGRPEAVASLPDYRNRGLVRGIFDLFHARSAARHQMAQGITGIGYFYRQFGYEYAIDLEGAREVSFRTLPRLKEGQSEPFSLRPATLEDLPFLRTVYERECHGFPGYEARVTTAFDESWWRWIFDGQNPESGQGCSPYIVIDTDGQALGYVMTSRLRWNDALGIFGISAADGAPLNRMLPSMLRGLEAISKTLEPWRVDSDTKEPNRLIFVLGDSHPIYAALNHSWVSKTEPAYAWYVRVPNLPAFMHKIAPSLERRLANSPAAGYSGDLKLDFYRDGLRLVFENGKLTTSEQWRRPVWNPETKAGFPPLVFLQLLFGRRSLADLRYAFPDVWADDDTTVVLNALFPKQRSWAIGQD
jgi:hypothetical protein